MVFAICPVSGHAETTPPQGTFGSPGPGHFHSHTGNFAGSIRRKERRSAWSTVTVRNVIAALGFRANGGLESLKNLSGYLADCAKHGAQGGYPGFTCYSDTLAFFRHNRQDIVKNMELLAGEIGEDITGMVQGFGVFRYDTPPSADDIGRALWGTCMLKDDLTGLYNVFSWFALEEISHVWYSLKSRHFL